MSRRMTRRISRYLPALLLAIVFAVALAGCKYLPAKTIDAPSEGSPEWVVYKFIEGAQKSDTMDAWNAVRPLLHSSLVELRTSEDNFLNLNFSAFRRKVNYFTPKDGTPTYELKYTEDVTSDKELILFVINEQSDMPSPFRMMRDPKSNNEWRVKNIP